MEHSDSARQRLYRRLLAEGLRLTSPRRALLELLLEQRAAPLSAIEVYRELNARKRGIVSRATVYRSLELLHSAGILSRAEKNQQYVYSLARSAGSTVLLCDRRDGSTLELAALPALERFIARITPAGFRPERAVLEIHGLFDRPQRRARKR